MLSLALMAGRPVASVVSRTCCANTDQEASSQATHQPFHSTPNMHTFQTSQACFGGKTLGRQASHQALELLPHNYQTAH